MAGNNLIQLLRGSDTNSNHILKAGQPFYNKTRRYLQIGDGTRNTQNPATVITVKDVIGYVADVSKITPKKGTSDYVDGKYFLSLVETGTNTKKYTLNLETTNPSGGTLPLVLKSADYLLLKASKNIELESDFDINLKTTNRDEHIHIYTGDSGRIEIGSSGTLGPDRLITLSGGPNLELLGQRDTKLRANRYLNLQIDNSTDGAISFHFGDDLTASMTSSGLTFSKDQAFSIGSATQALKSLYSDKIFFDTLTQGYLVETEKLRGLQIEPAIRIDSDTNDSYIGTTDLPFNEAHINQAHIKEINSKYISEDIYDSLEGTMIISDEDDRNVTLNFNCDIPGDITVYWGDGSKDTVNFSTTTQTFDAGVATLNIISNACKYDEVNADYGGRYVYKPYFYYHLGELDSITITASNGDQATYNHGSIRIITDLVDEIQDSEISLNSNTKIEFTPTAYKTLNHTYPLGTYKIKIKGMSHLADCIQMKMSTPDADKNVTPGEIPDTHYGLFYNVRALRSAIIHDGVYVIPSGTFHSAWNLNKIDIGPDVYDIRRSAFNNCNELLNCNINGRLTRLGPKVFKDCFRLQSLNANTSTGIESYERWDGDDFSPTGLDRPPYSILLYEEVFADCIGLIEVDLPQMRFAVSDYYKYEEERVTRGARLFRKCKSLTKFPNIVDSTIPSECFEESTALKQIIIPRTCTKIEDQAFKDMGSGPEYIIFTGAVEVGSKVFKDTHFDRAVLPDYLKLIYNGTNYTSNTRYYGGDSAKLANTIEKFESPFSFTY